MRTDSSCRSQANDDDIRQTRKTFGGNSHVPDMYGAFDAGRRAVVSASATARLLIVSQAPGRKVHLSGIRFNDVSGDRLREWMGIDKEAFYDAGRVAMVPMGFCFPAGSAHGGDQPPRPECAPTWHPRLLPLLKQVRLTLAIGQYAQTGMLGVARGSKLTGTVRDWRTCMEHGQLPLPHPSPRNRPWVMHNPWFETELLPVLREHVATLLNSTD